MSRVLPTGDRDPIFVFVVGCPRSGTTLVGELIAMSPHAFNAEESFFIFLLENWRAMLRPPVAPLIDAFLDQVQDLMRNLIVSATHASQCTHYVDHTPWHALCIESVWRLFRTLESSTLFDIQPTSSRS